ncbi:MAG: protein-(glutamine-N5) methyltransferase, release factor-specific, partial [Methylococcales bacterium]
MIANTQNRTSSLINTVENLLSIAIQQLDNTSPSARLDAEILLAFSLNKSRTWLRTWPEQRVDQSVSNQFNQLIEQRHQCLPIAYLIGQREFW